MLVLLLLLISRLINRSGLRIFHSKVFSSGIYKIRYLPRCLSDKGFKGTVGKPTLPSLKMEDHLKVETILQ